jgi:hypothetical protein
MDDEKHSFQHDEHSNLIVAEEELSECDKLYKKMIVGPRFYPFNDLPLMIKSSVFEMLYIDFYGEHVDCLGYAPDSINPDMNHIFETIRTELNKYLFNDISSLIIKTLMSLYVIDSLDLNQFESPELFKFK